MFITLGLNLLQLLCLVKENTYIHVLMQSCGSFMMSHGYQSGYHAISGFRHHLGC